MKKLILGMSAMALMASAAFAGEGDDTKVAAAEVSAANFTKLDADADGRISAIEAANNSKIAAGFTVADADKDGYLSKAEYAQLGKSSMDSDSGAAQPRSSSSTPEPSVPSDSSETAPQPR